MDEIYLNKLEFNKIRDIIFNKCFSSEGKNIAKNLLPFSDKDKVFTELSETTEAVTLIIKNSDISISIYNDSMENNDIAIYIKTLESNGYLSAKALLSVGSILKVAQELKEYFFRDYINAEDFPHLNTYFSELYSNPNIIKKIFSSILDEETIADNASANLNNIRKKRQKLEQDIKDKLNSFIHSSSFSKYIQESIVTIRNDRFVIPIKSEYRSQIKGFVHDVSSSGSTIFIEPISIFEMNNTVNDLKLEENIEIEKILRNLSSLLYPFTEELRKDIKLIGKLDFIFAKARYSIELNATCPIISDKKCINLINARHPLIDKNCVIPISLELGNSYDILVITGPNTGGKTVTIKTVGLLCVMALCGLHIPADEGSSVFVFDQIFTDIGDDQSIIESLSTFSSHISNIIKILKFSTKNSLVLLDELGSGTDPLEGANLAISILEKFEKIGVLAISTTHYQELKKYALVKENFMNASVEFDIENLKPTYNLLIGIPGKSNAFAISKKLGLDTSIIDRASSLIDDDEIHIEDLLKEINDSKSQIEKEKVQYAKLLKEAEELCNLLQSENENLKHQEEAILNKAKDDARQILLDAKDTANEIINKLSTSSNSEANKLRNSLNSSIKNLSITKKINNNLATKNALSKEEIKPNTKVFINSLSQEGIIISNVSKSDEVRVQIGNIKMNVKISDLERSKEKPTQQSVVSTSISSKSKSVSSEINVIGLTVEEAIFVIDKYLDDCILAKLETARIIHGKGTGALKNGIWKFLKTRKGIKSFRIGTFGEGEMGATIVILK
jgi:DNA mismatch repair protein MutS2